MKNNNTIKERLHFCLFGTIQEYLSEENEKYKEVLA
jgi:hypothetical protein